MNPSVRQHIAAGAFYPAHPDKLAKAIQDFMRDARPRLLSKPLALIAPHAGYVFSGQICADVFNQAAGEDFETIIILGANHSRSDWHKNGVYPGLGFQTPLGLLEIDRTLAEAIVSDNADCVYDSDIHTQEHSIEVILPFVKTLFPSAKIVPIIVGNCRIGNDIGINEIKCCEDLGATLAKKLSGKKALIVASTDLSHYPSYADAIHADCEFIKALLTMDAKAVRNASKRLLAQGIPGLSTCACGEAAALAAIIAAKTLGADAPRLVSYANSGNNALADRKRVVGYLAAVFGKGALAEQDVSGIPDKAATVSSGAGMTSEATSRTGKTGGNALASEIPTAKEQEEMLKIARETLTRYLGSQSLPLPRDYGPYLQKYRGVFVTLKKRGALRGCIGAITPSLPLCQLIGRVALESALEDRRFRQVSFAELADIEIEISLLTPPSEVAELEEIVLGRDGVIINKNGKSALFLPQVASEQGWTKEVWLTELALKAGLAPDGWRSGARFYTFQAVVFGEKTPPMGK